MHGDCITYVFLLFLGKVMFAKNKTKIKITWDKKLTTTYTKVLIFKSVFHPKLSTSLLSLNQIFSFPSSESILHYKETFTLLHSTPRWGDNFLLLSHCEKMPNLYNMVTSIYAKFAHNALVKEVYVPKVSFWGRLSLILCGETHNQKWRRQSKKNRLLLWILSTVRSQPQFGAIKWP